MLLWRYSPICQLRGERQIVAGNYLDIGALHGFIVHLSFNHIFHDKVRIRGDERLAFCMATEVLQFDGVKMTSCCKYRFDFGTIGSHDDRAGLRCCPCSLRRAFYDYSNWLRFMGANFNWEGFDTLPNGFLAFVNENAQNLMPYWLGLS